MKQLSREQYGRWRAALPSSSAWSGLVLRRRAALRPLLPRHRLWRHAQRATPRPRTIGDRVITVRFDTNIDPRCPGRSSPSSAPFRSKSARTGWRLLPRREQRRTTRSSATRRSTSRRERRRAISARSSASASPSSGSSRDNRSRCRCRSSSRPKSSPIATTTTSHRNHALLHVLPRGQSEGGRQDRCRQSDRPRG